jgi:3D (Asp-Asp-Asp) domain-containing protein
MRRAMWITSRALGGTVAVVAGWFAMSALTPSDAATSLATESRPVTSNPPLVQIATISPVAPASAPATSIAPPPAPLPPHDASLGTFKMTRYYMTEETGFVHSHSDRDPDDAVALAATSDIDPGGEVTIYDDRGCKPIATIGARFAEVLDVQGTGRLRDGRTVNVSDDCRCGHSPCYRALGDDAKWGMSATMKPLVPFRTVAVDPKVIPLGTVLYIPELDGMTMPGAAPYGGFVHDGCVVAADVGGHIVGQHVDFFIGRFAYKRELDSRRKMPHVTIYRGEGRCGHGSQVARNSGS